MRHLLIALYLLPTLALAQQLHTFRNGEVADADKLNESLQYVLSNASGGCSVEQVDNTAEITCADGTTAVVPGYGTVVVVPSGSIIGSVPDISSIPVGQVYVVDANNVAMGRLYRVVVAETRYQFWVDWNTEDLATSGSFYLDIDNRDATLHLRSTTFFYASEDCTGQPVTEPGDTYNLMYSADDQQFYVVSQRDWADGFLAKSMKVLPSTLEAQADSQCSSTEQIIRIRIPIAYNPPSEILNAAYPVRLKQY